MTDPASRALFERAERLLPGGVNSPVRAFRAVGGSPVFVQKASGARLVGADGKEYVDLLGGIAVTGAMLITTLLTYVVVRRAWRLPAAVAFGATAFFVTLDGLLFIGCAVKFLDGGWFPIALGLGLFVLMSTWQRGRALALASIRRGQPLADAALDHRFARERLQIGETGRREQDRAELEPSAAFAVYDGQARSRVSRLFARRFLRARRERLRSVQRELRGQA